MILLAFDAISTSMYGDLCMETNSQTHLLQMYLNILFGSVRAIAEDFFKLINDTLPDVCHTCVKVIQYPSYPSQGCHPILTTRMIREILTTTHLLIPMTHTFHFGDVWV